MTTSPSSLEQIQKAFKNHDVGTDEFRAFVDYFTFEDMSLASIDDLVAAYDKAIEKAKRWNTEDDSGIWRFYDDFKNGYLLFRFLMMALLQSRIWRKPQKKQRFQLAHLSIT